MKKMVLGNSHPLWGIPSPEIPTDQIPPWKIPHPENSLLKYPHPFHWLPFFTLFWQVFTKAKTSPLLKHRITKQSLSNINDSGDNEKKRELGWEYLKTWVGIFQVGIIWMGIFQEGIHQGGVLLVEIFRVRVFLLPEKIYAKNFQVYMHWNWSSSEKLSFSIPIASMFSPPPMKPFSYGVEIFPHPLVHSFLVLIGYVSALIVYIER